MHLPTRYRYFIISYYRWIFHKYLYILIVLYKKLFQTRKYQQEKLGILQVFQPFQFIFYVLKAMMRISVKRNPYIAMPHKVLQRLRIHSRFCHITAIRMPANMRRDIRDLHLINIVVPFYHMIKPMFPVHCHQWQAFFIHKQKTGISVHHLFYLGLLPILNDGLKAFCNILCYRKFSRSGRSLCWLNY